MSLSPQLVLRTLSNNDKQRQTTAKEMAAQEPFPCVWAGQRHPPDRIRRTGRLATTNPLTCRDISRRRLSPALGPVLPELRPCHSVGAGGTVANVDERIEMVRDLVEDLMGRPICGASRFVTWQPMPAVCAMLPGHHGPHRGGDTEWT